MTNLKKQLIIDKIVFAGAGHGGVVALKSLQDKFSIIEVVSTDEDVLKILRKTDKIIHDIASSKLDIVVCAGYANIISKSVLDNKVIINTHPSLLPKYRGRHSLVWAMLNFEKEVGFSIHLMNEYMDDGDILEQFKIKCADRTSQEIMSKFDEYVLHNLGRVVNDFLKGKIKPIKQNRNEATWVCKRNFDDCLIDFAKSNEYIEMLFRALVRPYPLPMIKVKNTYYEITDYGLIKSKYEMHLGRVVNIENGNAFVKINDGILIIKGLIDFDTKKVVDISNLLKIGQRL